MYQMKKRAGSAAGILMKVIISAIFIFPFLWMLSLSIQTDAEAARLTIISRSPTLKNFITAWNGAPFAMYIKNSIIIICSIIVLQTLIMVPAAYAFAKFEFKGKNILFSVILLAFMMPVQVTFIPIYYMMSDLGWSNTLLPQIIPSMTNAFGIFLLRQYFMQVPDELVEAARLDNAGEVQVIAKIMLPMAKPGISAIALLSFIGHWNDYFWPMIMTNSDKLRPITVGVASLRSTEGNDTWNVLMAGNMFLVLPILLVYIFASKYIINSFAYSGIK